MDFSAKECSVRLGALLDWLQQQHRYKLKMPPVCSCSHAVKPLKSQAVTSLLQPFDPPPFTPACSCPAVDIIKDHTYSVDEGSGGKNVHKSKRCFFYQTVSHTGLEPQTTWSECIQSLIEWQTHSCSKQIAFETGCPNIKIRLGKGIHVDVHMRLVVIC